MTDEGSSQHCKWLKYSADHHAGQMALHCTCLAGSALFARSTAPLNVSGFLPPCRSDHESYRAMTILKMSQIDQVRQIPLDATLVRQWVQCSDDHAQEIINAVLHEAAHLTAAIACRSCAIDLYIHPRPQHAGAGSISSADLLPEHEAFISIVGLAWECETHPDDPYGGLDDKRRFGNELKSAQEYVHVTEEEMLELARHFVSVDAKSVIYDAAKAILCYLPKNGHLGHAKLKLIRNWLKPRIPTYDTLKANAAKRSMVNVSPLTPRSAIAKLGVCPH